MFSSNTQGGTIYATSTNITLDETTFTHIYQAGRYGYGGGGAILYCSGILQVSNSMFTENRASGSGGAV